MTKSRKEQVTALALAAEVQSSLLPQYDVKIPGLEVAGKNISCDVIRHNAENSAADILGAVYDELGAYTRGRKSADDITLVVAKVGDSR